MGYITQQDNLWSILRTWSAEKLQVETIAQWSWCKTEQIQMSNLQNFFTLHYIGLLTGVITELVKFYLSLIDLITFNQKAALLIKISSSKSMVLSMHSKQAVDKHLLT